MKIYKVERIEPTGYDQYKAFVCYANDEKEAKSLNPCFPNVFDSRFERFKNDKTYHVPFYYADDEDEREEWVKCDDDLRVHYLGEAPETSQVGVILSSYIHG